MSSFLSPAHLEISDNASERLKERRITRQMVRLCIEKGRLFGVDINGRRVKQILIKKRALIVVYLGTTKGQLVVTAYWKES